jgi:MGT family glycosyltransferase
MTTSRFLFCTVPVAGHVNPGLPIAQALVERGHEVRWYTGRQFQAAVEGVGATFEPIVAATDPAEHGDLEARFPERAGLEGMAGFKFDLKHLFLDEVPLQLEDLRRITAGFAPDALVVDTGFVGARAYHELGGPVWATYGITALTLGSRDTAPFGTGLPPGTGPLSRLRNRAMTTLADKVLFRDVQKHNRQVRARAGLAPSRTGILQGPLSEYLYLQSSTEAFEYPRSDLAPQVHYVGPLLPDVPASFTAPDWWGDLDAGPPVVLVTQGTVATVLDDLVAPALAGLAGEDALVIATGGAGRDGLRGEVPSNARIEAFVPFGALLPKVSAMVTNGGYGGVQFALSHGVPLVVAGTTEDKPEVAARVAWSGAGLRLGTRSPTAEQVGDAVRRVLTDPAYRANAERIAAGYRRHDAPAEAADLLERLATTRRPVLRGAATVPAAAG